ncbi:MAG: nitroreductase family protein [Candidatus Peribacteraceae bacterium]|nr:nitroreductase family protein [Candidatus Peribacteraceae bacterium]MBP9850470.1 nitroreductase family protein [Candidatus Peribacteraceae bacterium]
MTYEELFQLLSDRRSIRYFQDTPIERQVLEKIFAAGILAPSVENTQPWHFHVLENQDIKTKMMECSCYGDFVVGSAAFIVVSCNKAAKGAQQMTIWNPREMEYSCVAAMQQMMLAATALGIGTCWVSLHHGPAHNLLKLPDHHVVIGGILFGYMKEAEKNASGEHQRKPLTDSVTYYA